ncbi:hypothetical protein HYPSUDRAFT_202713 [Hypholoma sublateritium FD-334 SS-4]|uniref:VWFA domain-containing protein n=1 Tax=Hypholoma sublateritium (strain FD-334 SS-4) TaxID=945553 RepID=A0A0D2ME23_HYPSF|nr:hypothetical protein HYPSUDRAFT_202713 [Hypholoma sublateritium FD-334 SS-4]
MVSFSPFSTPQVAANASQNAPQDGSGTSGSTMPLDIVFLQDTTGSQGPYIKAATKAIRDICDKISSTAELSKELIQFGLIAFRDHPPQDKTYVTKNFGFTSDINVMQRNLASLIASGGGDGPEAQTAALADALNMEWTEKAVKLVILITDSPPHGLGERGDGFSESPDQNDPLEIVRQMAERGITLFVVACEPSLSQQYMLALDFYIALTKITSGQVFPLLMADRLGDYIVGTAVEAIDTEKLIGEFEKVIVNDVYANAVPVERVAENLQQYMNEKGRKINTFAVEDIYVPYAAAERNRMMWERAGKLSDARGSMQPISEPRIQAQFLPATSGFGAGFGPPWAAAPTGPMMGAGMGAGLGAATYSVAPTLYSGPAVPIPPVQSQQVSYGVQQVSQSQAHRIVTQSIARNSKVTAAGMFSKKGGQAATTESTDPV